MKNQKKLINYLADNIDAEISDVLIAVDKKEKEKKKMKGEGEKREGSNMEIVGDYIVDFLNNYFIKESEMIGYNKENNDFWNNLNNNGSYWCDIATEWADSMADLYSSDLWDKAQIFSEYITEALDEFGVDGCGIKKGGIEKLLMAGQYTFYNAFTNNILTGLKEYSEEVGE